MVQIQVMIQIVNLKISRIIIKEKFVSAFHEALSDAIALSVRNPIHLHRIGLFNNNTDLYETNMNFLLMMALEKVAYIPFAYLVDQVIKI